MTQETPTTIPTPIPMTKPPSPPSPRVAWRAAVMEIKRSFSGVPRSAARARASSRTFWRLRSDGFEGTSSAVNVSGETHGENGGFKSVQRILKKLHIVLNNWNLGFSKWLWFEPGETQIQPLKPTKHGLSHTIFLNLGRKENSGA